MNKESILYESPAMEIIKIDAEQGFATSGGPDYSGFGDEEAW